MSTPLRARADVPTAVPDRYAKQLVSHLGRKVVFTTEGEPATVGTASTAAFFEHGTGSVVVGEGVLTLIAESPAPEGLARVQHILGDHLERFGQRDALRVEWVQDQAAAEAG